MGDLDKYAASKHEIEKQALLLAVYGALSEAVSRGGGELQRVSLKLGEGECLMVLNARFPGGLMVGFVGAEDMPAAFVKATREAGRDQIRWREDNYR